MQNLLSFIEADVTWLAAFAVAFLLLYNWYRRPNNQPPGPRGIPILGVLPFLGKYPERVFRKWSKSYGPIMSVRMGRTNWITLNDYETINQAFVKQHTKVSGRPHIPFFQQITQGHGVVFIDYGDLWKTQRKFGLMTLRGFGVGKRCMESRIVEEVSYLNDVILSEDGKPFNISVLLHNAVSNNICNIVMGKRFEYDDSRFTEIMHRLLRGFDDPVANAMSTVLIFAPKLMKIPPFSNYNNALMDDVRVIMELLREIVEEHEETFDNGDLRDFIDAFIAEMKKNKNDDSFSRIQLIQFVRDLFVAGTETTSSTLYWALLCLLHYPQTQTKLRKEIMDVIGSTGTISMSHKSSMPYTNAFIQELYRFRTLAPMSVPHMTNEDVELNGYFIPKGTTVSANLWAVHNDPELWDEPEKFKPDRFIDESGNFIHSNHVISFSVGPRHCLGEQLARMEVFIFLVSMIQKFEFLPDPTQDKLPDIVGGSNGTTFVPTPYKIVAKLI